MNRNPADSAFRLRGSWRDYAPLAFENLFVCAITLGLYVPWAVTASRRHLTERVSFILVSSHWTGDPRRLFGAMLAVVLGVVTPMLGVQLAALALIGRGQWLAAALVEAALIPALGFAAGLIRFRALGYRLRHSEWKGRCGTQADNGVAYGLAAARAAAVVALTLGIAWPWAAVTLWNRRWSAMGFGTQPFEPQARAAVVARRFAPAYLLAVAIVVGVVMAVAWPWLALAALAWIAAAAWYQAGFIREGFGRMGWSGLHMGFDARDRDWLRLAFGHVALIVATLGIGAALIPYRNWDFLIRHLRADGDES